MSESNEEWELSKENIRPIEQGRKQNVLKVALAPHPEDVITQQRQAFENELRTYSGNDPLAVWCKYIKWVEQNFPKGGREGHIKKLMDSCLSILKDDKRYFDDERFIDIMLKYANLSGKPIEIYNYMYSSNIGCKSSRFFINWSWELEQLGNLKKADEVISEGIRCNAEPVEKIQSYRTDFEIRLVNKIKANSERNNFEPESSRSAFAVLKPQKKNLAPIMRTGAALVENKSSLIIGRQQSQPKSTTSSGKAPFKIYGAENVNPFLPAQSRSVASSGFSLENFKENEQKPTKWNKFKVKSHGLKAPNEANPDFKFHCDEENDQEVQTPRSVPKTSSILSTHRRTPSPPIALFEPPDPLKRPMYPKNKVYGGAVEYSLEEIRAAEWREKQKKIEQEKLLKQQQEKIEEHAKNEEQLKKEIEFLSKRLQLLETRVSSSTSLNNLPNTLMMNSYEMPQLEPVSEVVKNGFNEILNKQTKSSMQAQNNNIPAQHTGSKSQDSSYNYSTEISNNDLKSNHQDQNYKLMETIGKESTDSPSFYTADRMIQELYNRTLSDTADEDENKKLDLNKVNDTNLTHSISNENSNKPPFTFFHDPTEKIPDSNGMSTREFLNENSLPSLNTTKHIGGEKSVKKASDKLPFTFYHDSSGKMPKLISEEFVDENSLSGLNASKCIGEAQSVKEPPNKLPFTLYNDSTEKVPDLSARKFPNENSLSSLNATKHIDEAQSIKKTLYKLPFTLYNNSTEKVTDLSSRKFMEENSLSGLNSSKQPHNSLNMKDSHKSPFTFYHDSTNNISNSCEAYQINQKQTLSKESSNELPFSFFHDSTGKMPESDKSTSVKKSEEQKFEFPDEESSEEDIENIPPNEYIQNATKRELAGILQPSKNVLYIPLEQQELDDESDLEDDYIYQNGQQPTDDTLIPPSNTEQFSAAKFLASTPYVARNRSSLDESDHQIPPSSENKISEIFCPPTEHLNSFKQNIVDDENAVSKIEMISSKEQVVNNDLKSACLSRLPNTLSVIMETSNENYSKSSSSSSSASLTKSNHLEHYSAQHLSLHKNFTKLEINSVSEVSNHNSDMNIRNSSIIVNRENNKEVSNKISTSLYEVDFDPFDVDIIQRLLKSIDISNYKNICHVGKSMRAVKPGENICIGDSTYMIEDLIAEGAYAKVYKATKSFETCGGSSSAVLALKVCRKGNEWEFYICLEVHRRLSELNLIPDIKNSIMDVISAIKYTDGIVLANEYNSSGTLLDVVNFYKKQNSTIPELITMYFTLEILHIVSKLHKCNIIHGDVKPDNFMLTNDNFSVNILEKMTETTCLKLIDFGRAIDLNLYEKGICFTTAFSSKDLQCNEMKDKKPWVFQLDWYGVLSCIYTMLFSEYMAVSKKNDVWEIEKKFKRYWFISLWEPLFNKLLNIPECYEEPDISPFITMIESRLQQNANSFINQLARFSYSFSRRV